MFTERKRWMWLQFRVRVGRRVQRKVMHYLGLRLRATDGVANCILDHLDIGQGHLEPI